MSILVNKEESTRLTREVVFRQMPRILEKLGMPPSPDDLEVDYVTSRADVNKVFVKRSLVGDKEVFRVSINPAAILRWNMASLVMRNIFRMEVLYCLAWGLHAYKKMKEPDTKLVDSDMWANTYINQLPRKLLKRGY